MRLLSISYFVDNVHKYAIMLEIGRRNDKICGLYSHLMPDSDVNKITKAAPIIDQLPLEDTGGQQSRIRWLRENINSFDVAWREITADKVQIEDVFEIGKKNG